MFKKLSLILVLSYCLSSNILLLSVSNTVKSSKKLPEDFQLNKVKKYIHMYDIMNKSTQNQRNLKTKIKALQDLKSLAYTNFKYAESDNVRKLLEAKNLYPESNLDNIIDQNQKALENLKNIEIVKNKQNK